MLVLVAALLSGAVAPAGADTLSDMTGAIQSNLADMQDDFGDANHLGDRLTCVFTTVAAGGTPMLLLPQGVDAEARDEAVAQAECARTDGETANFEVHVRITFERYIPGYPIGSDLAWTATANPDAENPADCVGNSILGTAARIECPHQMLYDVDEDEPFDPDLLTPHRAKIEYFTSYGDDEPHRTDRICCWVPNEPGLFGARDVVGSGEFTAVGSWAEATAEFRCVARSALGALETSIVRCDLEHDGIVIASAPSTDAPGNYAASGGSGVVTNPIMGNVEVCWEVEAVFDGEPALDEGCAGGRMALVPCACPEAIWRDGDAT